MVSLLAGVVMIVGGLVQAPSQPAKTPAPPSETATQFYLRYRAAVANATSVDEVLTFFSDDAANEYKSAPPDERVDLAGMKRMNGMVSGVTVTREAVSTGPGTSDAMQHACDWLAEVTTHGARTPPSPIGFYFAKLWYYEKTYPQIFTVAALSRVVSALDSTASGSGE
jgi:hypothetical protein